MNYDDFIHPQTVEVGGREYVVGRIPAFTAKPVYAAVVDVIRKEGDIGKSLLPDEIVKTIFCHIATLDDKCQYEVLSTEGIIGKYLWNYADFIELTVKAIDVNFGFFADGTLRNLLGLPAEGEMGSDS